MTTIYVGNIPYSATESSLRELFERHGRVVKVALPTDCETGRIRGFGFIEMPEADAARAIAELNDFDYSGRSLRVNEARAREER